VRAQDAALTSGFRYSLSWNKAHSKHRTLLANRLYFGVVDKSDDYLHQPKPIRDTRSHRRQNIFQRLVLFHEGRFSPLGPRGIRRPASLLGFGPTTSRHIVHDRLHRRRAQLRAIPKHLDHCVEGRVPFEPKARIPPGQRNQLTVGALASVRRRPQLPFCKIQPRPFGPTAFPPSIRCKRLKTRGPSRAATFKLRLSNWDAAQIGAVVSAFGSNIRRSGDRSPSASPRRAFRFSDPPTRG
jgi:hypothetical protein